MSAPGEAFGKAERSFARAVEAFKKKDLEGCDEILRADFFPVAPLLDELQVRRFTVRARECGLDRQTFRGFVAKAERLFLQERGASRAPAGPRPLSAVDDPDRRKRAEDLAADPTLLERFSRDAAAAGVVGVEKQVLLTLLVGASGPLLPHPLSLIVKGDTAEGKSYPTKRVLDFLPPEVVLLRSRLSALALFHSDENLEGAVLFVEEYAGADQADYPIRLAQSEGKLISETTVKRADGSGFETQRREKTARLAILLTTNRVELDAQNESRAFSIFADGTPEQTRCILQAESRRAASAEELLRERSAVVEPWRDFFRMLRAMPVVVPFAEELEASFPADRPRARRDFASFLGAIQVCALLHQQQREIRRESRGGEQVEVLVADRRDADLVRPLVACAFASAIGGLSERGRRVLEVVERLSREKSGEAVRTGEVFEALRPDGIAPRTVRGHLSEAVEAGFLVRVKGGRGVEGEYRPLRSPGAADDGELRELADDLRQEGSHAESRA